MKSTEPLWLALIMYAGVAACGIHDYPHETQHHDSTNDFAPIGQGGQGDNDVDAQRPYIGHPDAAVDAAASTDAAQALDAGRSMDQQTDAGTPPPVKGDIELGGAQLRKQDVLAFIHFGHSNMTGFATGPDELRAFNFTEVHPRAWKYHVGKPPEPALEPTAREDTGAYAGPGVSLLKQAAERSPKKYFMSLGYGAAGVYCTQFLPGSLFFESITKAAIAIKSRVTFAAIIVMLGSTEIHGSDADRRNFPECINKLVTAVREAVGEPDLPMLISGYEMEATGIYAADGEFATQIIPQIARIPSVVSNSAVVPADGLAMEDDHHFNLLGHKVWTQRVLDTMKDKGWAPWLDQ